MEDDDKFNFLDESPFFEKSPNHGNWTFKHDNHSYIDDKVLNFIPLDQVSRYGFYLSKDRKEAQEIIFGFLAHLANGQQISKREYGLAAWILSSIVYDMDDARPLPHKKIRGKGQHKKETILDRLSDDKKIIYFIEGKIHHENKSLTTAIFEYINLYPNGKDPNTEFEAIKIRIRRLRKKYGNEWWYPKRDI